MAGYGGLTIKPLGQVAAFMARVGQQLYRSPGDTIRGVDPNNWPTASQPVQPIGPPGSQPLGFPFWYGQNLIFTPRFDAHYTAADLRMLSTYPLARICIENTKDQLCQLDWKIQLRQKPGETRSEIKARRKKDQNGDPMIKRLSQFFERPNSEQNFSEWLRPVLDDMLTTDAASILVRKKFSGELAEVRWVPGDSIVRYIDDNGFTPLPPDPAYAQLWEGTPRINLNADQLIYKPRNVVPRNSLSSYLYGLSPVEQLAEEIKVGMARLAYVQRFYDKGSLGNVIQVVPPKVPPDKVREAQDANNSELGGNLAARRQWHMVQGFEDGGKDQILFPKEPVLADYFDDVHVRKICFGFGTSPQRLQKMLNRGSAQTSQQAATDEGIRPWIHWIKHSIAGELILRMTGGDDYEMELQLVTDTDELKQAKTDDIMIKGGKISINETREEAGWDPIADPAADQLAITTAQGRVPIGQLPSFGAGGAVPRGSDKPVPANKFLNGEAHYE